jgi:hypothetical protein
MSAPPSTQTSDPISTGLPNLRCLRVVGIERVHQRENLCPGAEQCLIPETHFANIEDDAVNVKENRRAEINIFRSHSKKALASDRLAAAAE